MTSIDNKIFIRPAEIKGIYGIGRSTAYQLMSENKFPKLVKLSKRCVGWRKDELDKHFSVASGY